MKKIITLLFLFIIILNFNNEKNEPVFNELNSNYLLQDKNTYNIVYLDISNLSLTTKKYNQIKNLEIIGVYYEIPELYFKIFKTNYYEFKTPNIDKNMNSLNEYYLNNLKQNNLIKEQNKIYINGIKLKKVKTYISNEQLYEFLKNDHNVTYSLDLNNNYQSI